MTFDEFMVTKYREAQEYACGVTDGEQAIAREAWSEAVAAEREACAKVCDNYEPLGMKEGPQTVAYEIALEIRARKEGVL